MKILVINSNNKQIKNSIETMRKNVGKENVTVIEYGNEYSVNIKNNTKELQEILQNNPVKSDQYDLLLIAGGHGDVKTYGNFNSTRFNDLTPDGVNSLITYCKNNEITFKNILLGTCFSANLQNDFKTLLNDDGGSILSFTTVATDNLSGVAEELAANKKPNLETIVAHGMITVMNEIKMDVLLENSVTPLEEKLYRDYETQIESIVDEADKIGNARSGAEIEKIANLDNTIDRIIKTEENIANSSFISAEDKNIIILKIKPVLSQLRDLKQNPTNVANYNSSRELTEMRHAFEYAEKIVKNKYEKQLIDFIKNNHEEIIQAPNNKRLKGAITTSLSLYSDDKIYAQELHYLPTDVSKENFDQIKCANKINSKMEGDFKETRLFDLPQLYRNTATLVRDESYKVAIINNKILAFQEKLTNYIKSKPMAKKRSAMQKMKVDAIDVANAKLQELQMKIKNGLNMTSSAVNAEFTDIVKELDERNKVIEKNEKKVHLPFIQYGNSLGKIITDTYKNKIIEQKNIQNPSDMTTQKSLSEKKM